MLSTSIKGVAPEKFMDRFRQKMAESDSGYGQGEIFDLIYDISEKEPLLPVTFNKILERVDNLTKENPDVLNQKHFKRVFHLISLFSSNTKPTWRSPLELAIQRMAPVEVVMILINNGSKITNEALSIATLNFMSHFDHDLNSDKTAHSLSIIEALSLSGANWNNAFSLFVGFKNINEQDRSVAEDLRAEMSDHIISRIGSDDALKIGVIGDEVEIKDIDIKNFSEKIKKHRNLIGVRKAKYFNDDYEDSLNIKAKSEESLKIHIGKLK